MKTIKLKSDHINQVINNTITILKSSGLVIFPSDTVYGLLCDATNEQAVKKLIKFKNRPPGKAISIFCNFNLVNQLVAINSQQSTIFKQILPGPFTIILPSKHRVNKLLESETGCLGIRIPAFKLINRLIEGFGKPLTATSANLSGQSPHYSINTLLNEIPNKKKDLIDLIVDAGTLARNKPSTVVDLTQFNLKILRQGDMDIPNKSKMFLSQSTEETKEIANKVISNEVKNLAKSKLHKPLIFIIQGELGVGKTVFVKGLGESMGIKNIISPTFVIYYEYGNFYHFDLYRIEEKEEFRYLGIEKLLIPGNILCFEWGEKAKEIINLLKGKGKIIYIKIEYLKEKTRKIIIKD